MARIKTPKTKGVTEQVSTPSPVNPVVNAAPEANAQTAGTAVEKTANKVATPKNSVPKLETVKTEPRRNVVPINLEEEVRRLAYLMSERRGFEPGHEQEDWVAAENEVRQRYRQQSA